MSYIQSHKLIRPIPSEHFLLSNNNQTIYDN